jgi:glycosyltransferase involved in cell wall biosynthesis
LKSEHFYDLPPTIPVHEPNFKRTSSFLNKLFYYPKLIIFLRKKIKKINPDRVLVFGDWFSPITLLALFGTKYAIYISDRTIPNYTFKFPIPQLKKWLYPRSTGFIAQTHRAKVFKETIFGDRLRISVIPNALPEMHFPDTIENKNIILYAGRFAWEKDPEILIRSMPMVVKKAPDWTLRMAGNGPLLENMKALTQQLEISENVQFLGKVNDMGKLYAEASILILPSIVEGFPNTLIEAMSAKLPTICFSDIPYEDIVNPGVDGIVLNERSQNKLADAILELIANPELRLEMGLKATNVKKRFSASHIAEKIIKFMNI